VLGFEPKTNPLKGYRYFNWASRMSGVYCNTSIYQKNIRCFVVLRNKDSFCKKDKIFVRRACKKNHAWVSHSDWGAVHTFRKWVGHSTCKLPVVHSSTLLSSSNKLDLYLSLHIFIYLFSPEQTWSLSNAKSTCWNADVVHTVGVDPPIMTLLSRFTSYLC